MLNRSKNSGESTRDAWASAADSMRELGKALEKIPQSVFREINEMNWRCEYARTIAYLVGLHGRR